MEAFLPLNRIRDEAPSWSDHHQNGPKRRRRCTLGPKSDDKEGKRERLGKHGGRSKINQRGNFRVAVPPFIFRPLKFPSTLDGGKLEVDGLPWLCLAAA